ncbi:MAG: CRISPR-associated protein Csy1 [Paraglaciecola sp.]|jgi:CRISPR-associated protein Csy1
MKDKEIKISLARAIVSYIELRRDNKIESFYKDKPKRNKLGIIVNGAINSRLSDLLKKITQEKEVIISIDKSKKVMGQSSLAFQQKKYQKLLTLLPSNFFDEEILDIRNSLHEFLLNIEEEYKPVAWLSKMATKAIDISFATHVAKLTHSSSKGTSILDVTTDRKNQYLTTNTLTEPAIDTASSNAASLPIADVLKLSVDGVSVLDYLKQDDTEIFQHVTDDHELIELWCSQLKQAYDSTQKQSYFLSKQTYFPIGDGQYHLLLPLTSSSLVHALHLEHKKYWDEEQELARKRKSDKKYSSIVTRTYPNKAYLHITGSNHSNASSLNGQRGGRMALLAATPPQWSSRLPSYINKNDIFDKKLSYELDDEVNELKKYLQLIQNKQLSVSEPKRNAAVIRKLQAISEHFFEYIQQVNNVEDNNGWTIDSHLHIEQQLLFEPRRDDDIAKATKTNHEWQRTLSLSYGRWLNKQLKQRSKLLLTLIHESLWSEHFRNDLREFIATQEVMI